MSSARLSRPSISANFPELAYREKELMKCDGELSWYHGHSFFNVPGLSLIVEVHVPAGPSPSSASGSAPRTQDLCIFPNPDEFPVESSSPAPSDCDLPGPEGLFSIVTLVVQICFGFLFHLQFILSRHRSRFYCRNLSQRSNSSLVPQSLLQSIKTSGCKRQCHNTYVLSWRKENSKPNLAPSHNTVVLSGWKENP